MSINLEKALGFEQSPIPVTWNKRDLLTYAVGIGATKDDLQFNFVKDNPLSGYLVAERLADKSFAAFPTYPVVLNLKGGTSEVNNFAEAVGAGSPVPGLPLFDPNRGVHGSQSLEILKPLPLASGPGWKLTRRIVGVHENKAGIIVDNELMLLGPTGTPYTRMISSSFNVGAKGHGKPFSKTISSAPIAKPPPKDRKPDFVVTEKTTPEQAIVYRLSGDYNPLHIDPSIGNRAGFGGVILHGLSTYGFAARAVLSRLGGNDPTTLKTFGVRFTSPVKPGDTLETSIWEMGAGPGDTVEVSFITKNLTTGKISLGAGVAHIRKVTKSKL